MIIYIVYSQRKVGIETLNWNRLLVFSNYFKSDYEKSTIKNPSNYINLVSHEIPFACSILENFLNLSKEIFLMISIFIIAMYINLLATLIIITFLILFVILYTLAFRRDTSSKGELFRETKLKSIKIINETFDLFKEIKIYKKSNFFLKNFSSQLESFEKYKLINSVINALPRLFLEVGLLLIILVLIIVVNMMDKSIYDFFPILSFIAVSSIKLIPSFKLLSSSVNQINFAIPTFTKVYQEILESKKNGFSIEETIKEFKTLKKISNEDVLENIKLENVSFKYKMQEDEIINKVNLNFFKGDKIGLVGPSGIGKSTFINLLTGLLKPTNGKIVYNFSKGEINLNDYDNIIGYVPQNISIVSTSLIENIALGEPVEKINHVKVKKISKLLKIENLIKSSDIQSEIFLNNRGKNFSGGQIQRIGIARALYRNPKILILDESTNSLDVESEKDIINEIFKLDKKMIILIIAHRSESLSRCDKIYKLQNKKIIQTT